MLPCSNVKCTRTEYASSTTVGDLAPSYHSGLPAVVSTPMQGKQSVYRTSSTCECTFGSTFESQAVSSFHSTVLRNPSRILANVLPFISLFSHRVADHSPHPGKSDHRSASTCYGRLLDPCRYNNLAHVAIGVAECYSTYRESVWIWIRNKKL